MRIHGRMRLGYFPLDHAEGPRIAQHLHIPSLPAASIPARGPAPRLPPSPRTEPRRYGIELDAHRAEG